MPTINYTYGTRYEYRFALRDFAGVAHVYAWMVTQYYPEDCKPFYSLYNAEATRNMRFECIRKIKQHLN